MMRQRLISGVESRTYIGYAVNQINLTLYCFIFQNSFKRSNFMQNQISLNFKISYPPQSLFLFFCTEMYIPRFDIPCVKGSLCPASFCICQSNFSCNDSYFFSQRTGISHIGFRLLSIKLKMKVVTFENALKEFL